MKRTIVLTLFLGLAVNLKCSIGSENGIIASGKFRLPYQIEGRGIPAVVVGFRVYYPRVFSPALREHLRLVFLDHRVSAPSPGPVPESEFALDILADDIELARKQLGLGKVVVIGHSGNALIALEYAKKYPASVSHVVMIGIAPNFGPANSAARDRYWSESASPERKAAMEDSLRRLPDTELNKLPPQERSSKSYIRNGPKLWYNPRFDVTPLWHDVVVNLDGLAQVWDRHLVDLDITQGLAGFDRPVFLALGRYDFIVAPPSSWDPMRSKFKDLTIRIFERSGHTPQYEEADLFNEELVRWIKRSR